MRLFDGYIDRRPLMERDGSGVSALLGLEGFVVCAQLFDDAGGEWWLAVETTKDRAWCPACGVRTVGHGRWRVVVRDLPLADRPVVLVWAKRIWRCAEPACPARTWSEESDVVDFHRMDVRGCVLPSIASLVFFAWRVSTSAAIRGVYGTLSNEET
jgi:zinc-finger of transposase IS204/IS1001/IS1096/IS1165